MNPNGPCFPGPSGPASLAGGLRWLGHSSFRVDGSKTVYIDPWNLGPGPHPPADLVLVTHPHYDHCSPSDLARIPGIESAEIVTVADGARKIGRPCRVIAPGGRTTAKGVDVTAVAAYNKERPHHPRLNGWVGFLFRMDGRTIYHAGDTDRIPEMAEIRCQIALLPVGGSYTMNAEEAALAAGDMEAELAVPMHYGGPAGTEEDGHHFLRLSPVPVALLPARR
ncbi:MAG: MBL fold metallo-hydrolase [Candidatus Eisenbacteria bacterium]